MASPGYRLLEGVKIGDTAPFAENPQEGKGSTSHSPPRPRYTGAQSTITTDHHVHAPEDGSVNSVAGDYTITIIPPAASGSEQSEAIRTP